MRIDRILFPTDFSDCAERAFSHARRLAIGYGAELHVLNVGPEDARPVNDPMSFIRLEPENAVVRSDASSPDQLEGEIVLIHSRMTALTPVKGILEYSAGHDIDAIVMATHGRTGIDHILAGSVAEDVVRYAECPVYTVRCAGDVEPENQVKRILVPVDFSEQNAISAALDLARRYGAEVDVLHVIEEAVLPTIYGVEPLSAAAPLYLERTEEALRKHLASFDTGDLVVGSHVRVGNPARSILEFAHSQRCNLIVIGSNGRAGLGRFLMGSVAEKVVRLSHVPVFAFKQVRTAVLSGPTAKEA